MVLITMELNNTELNKAFRHIDKYSERVKSRINDQLYTSAYAIHRNIIDILRSKLNTTSSNLEAGLHVTVNKSHYKANINTNYKTKNGKYYIIDLLEEGTRPHPIVPRHALVLSFLPQASAMSIKSHRRSYNVGGKLTQNRESGRVFTRRVQHPGTKPIKMIETSLRREQPRYIQGIINILKTA